MKTLNTILGNVQILDVGMVRASGYGQYSIIIEIEHEGNRHTIKHHSTDSQLFDKVNGEDNEAEILLEDYNYEIERAIDDYISSL